MRIEVRCRTTDLNATGRLQVERAVALALGRFGTKVSLVGVTIEDDAAPDGAGTGHRVAVRIDGACRLLVLESGPSREAGLLRALDRTRRYLDREAARLQWRRRYRGGARAGHTSPAADWARRAADAFATREDDNR